MSWKQFTKTGTIALCLVTAALLLIMKYSAWREPSAVTITFKPPKTSNKPDIPKVIKKCELKNKGKCYGQCCEDHRLFERFFSKPMVCNGTYVEIGAYDGLGLTNTKFFEDSLGWSGVLIEGDPKNSRLLKKNRPKSITREMAVCKEGKTKVNFTTSHAPAVGGIIDHMSQSHLRQWSIKKNILVEVPCATMGKILQEARIKHIDLFSLDVEGGEMVVLETMDWTIPVKYFIVETQGAASWINSIKKYLKNKGFRPVSRRRGEGCSWNTVFENVNLVQKA